MSFKVTSNGRSTLPELQEKFEKVYIKYDRSEDGTARTTAILVNDGVAHVGVSKFSNRTFNFSRTKGRSMALGRAELSANIFYGLETQRESKLKRREELSFSIQTNSQEELEGVITSITGITFDKKETVTNS
jgi:hypothetical protein